MAKKKVTKRVIEELRSMFPDQVWKWRFDKQCWIGTDFNVAEREPLRYYRSDTGELLEELYLWIIE